MAEPVEFPSTMWGMISGAKRRSAEALEEICARYRRPVRAYLRSTGLSEEDAEDTTQQVFLRILEDDLLQKADQALGRFRSLLLGITKNILRERRRHDHAEKRGGGRTVLPLDARDPESSDSAWIEGLGKDEEDERFDSLWLMNLVDLAIQRLRREGGPHGEALYAALRMRVMEHAEYEKIAQAIGKSVSDVRNYLHRARDLVKRFVGESIREYCSSRPEYETEVRYLAKYLPS